MSSDNNSFKNIFLRSLFTAIQIIFYILLFSIILSAAASYIISMTFDTVDLSNHFLYLIGAVTNLMFVNNLGDDSLRIILLLIILIALYNKSCKKHLKCLNINDSIKYIIITSAIVSLILSSLIFLTSLIQLDTIIADINSTNFLITYCLIFLKSVLIFAGAKLYTINNKRICSGVRAFKNYVYKMLIFTFVFSVIIDIYFFIQVYQTDLAKYKMMGLIIVIFNICIYFWSMTFGGICEYSESFFGSGQLNVIDVISGEFGNIPLTLMIIGFSITLIIIYNSFLKIKQKNYFKNMLIFSLMVIIFNIILAYTSYINFLTYKLNIKYIPLVITTSIMVFSIGIVRRLVISIENVI